MRISDWSSDVCSSDLHFAPFLMRNSDDHTIKHRRMTEHNLLDLPGKHVEAARDDHVPLAVDDIDVTVCVTPAEVAAELPAIAADGRGCVRVLVKLRHLDRKSVV